MSSVVSEVCVSSSSQTCRRDARRPPRRVGIPFGLRLEDHSGLVTLAGLDGFSGLRRGLLSASSSLAPAAGLRPSTGVTSTAVGSMHSDALWLATVSGPGSLTSAAGPVELIGNTRPRGSAWWAFPVRLGVGAVAPASCHGSRAQEATASVVVLATT